MLAFAVSAKRLSRILRFETRLCSFFHNRRRSLASASVSFGVAAGAFLRFPPRACSTAPFARARFCFSRASVASSGRSAAASTHSSSRLGWWYPPYLTKYSPWPSSRARAPTIVAFTASSPSKRIAFAPSSNPEIAFDVARGVRAGRARAATSGTARVAASTAALAAASIARRKRRDATRCGDLKSLKSRHSSARRGTREASRATTDARAGARTDDARRATRERAARATRDANHRNHS